MIYVTSDLHGYPFEAFMKLLRSADFSTEDFLFILGDVIDRGNDGVKYLQWIMRQKNVELLLGNHEEMLLACDFLFEEITAERAESLTSEDFYLLQNWQLNGAVPTLEAMLDLSADERKNIIEYLREAPHYADFELNGQRFLLTHSGLKNFEKGKPIEAYATDDLLWNRPKLTDEYDDDVITIFGHTPTFSFGEEYNGKILKTNTWIDIDAGCARGNPPVLLRLDDMKIFTL